MAALRLSRWGHSSTREEKVFSRLLTLKSLSNPSSLPDRRCLLDWQRAYCHSHSIGRHGHPYARLDWKVKFKDALHRVFEGPFA